jgi:hypothetical protein
MKPEIRENNRFFTNFSQSGDPLWYEKDGKFYNFEGKELNIVKMSLKQILEYLNDKENTQPNID